MILEAWRLFAIKTEQEQLLEPNFFVNQLQFGKSTDLILAGVWIVQYRTVRKI